jgi:hypothetical protein
MFGPGPGEKGDYGEGSQWPRGPGLKFNNFKYLKLPPRWRCTQFGHTCAPSRLAEGKFTQWKPTVCTAGEIPVPGTGIALCSSVPGSGRILSNEVQAAVELLKGKYESAKATHRIDV